ncbi:MAG: hypothetical protein HY401_03625 [Elusimicrobia bacterium]|nr:hypothetical protein [Elusimicrobiota bacterium]
MPECVEVEITRKQLESALVGKELRSLSVFDPLLPPLPSGTAFGRLLEINRRGKILQFCFKSGRKFSISLGMML